MAGARLNVTVDLRQARAAAGRASQSLDNPQALLIELGEYLLGSTKDRFGTQTAPSGEKWQALSPRYLRRKDRQKDKVLTLRGYLRNQMAYQLDGPDAVLVGSNRIYAAIHQFGGTIDQPARAAEIHLRRNAKTNQVGRLFVKKSKSNFTKKVSVGPYKITLPARPYLGLSDTDRTEITQRTLDFVNTLLG